MGDHIAAARTVEAIARNQDENPAPPSFGVTLPGEGRVLSVSALGEGIERDAIPGLSGDLGTAEDVEALLMEGYHPCVWAGLYHSYVVTLSIPDSLGERVLARALACPEALYAERSADGDATNVFFFGVHALGAWFYGIDTPRDPTLLARWEAPDGRVVILNGWVELTGEAVELPEEREGSCAEILAEVGSAALAALLVADDAEGWPSTAGYKALIKLVIRDLDRWGKGPEDYHHDRSSHDMGACSRAAWYLRNVLHVRLDVLRCARIIAAAVREWLVGQGLDRPKYDTLRSGVPYLLATAQKAVAFVDGANEGDGSRGNRYRRQGRLPEEPDEDDVFGILYEVRRLGGRRSAVDATAYAVFTRHGVEVDPEDVEAAMLTVPADDVVGTRTTQVLEGCAASGELTDYARRLGEAAARRIVSHVDLLDLCVEDAAVVAQVIIDSHACLRVLGWGLHDTERELERILRRHGISYEYPRPQRGGGGDE